MSNASFIQIHTLTSYPGSLLNRDDVGFAKRLPFGGATRTRVSSQCLKRHWRMFEGAHSLRHLEDQGQPVETSIRSRLTFEKHLREPLESEFSTELATAVTAAIMKEVLGEKPKADPDEKPKKKGNKKGTSEAEAETTTGDPRTSSETKARLETGQLTVLGHPELRYLLAEARAICAANPVPKDAAKAVAGHFKGERGKNLRNLKNASGLDAALFGRMVTSDILARGDAAIHVAHAFTVHEEASETDYFTAVDDLLRTDDDEQLGSAHIGTTELTSGLFYGYVVIDVPLLISNLVGCKRSDWRTADRALAGEIVRRLLHIVAKVSPGAKLGSTAPYSFAHLVMVETGDEQPRTLGNAFLHPVSARRGLLDGAYEALAAHTADLDRMYGGSDRRRLAALGPRELLAPIAPADSHMSLDELASWAVGQLTAP